MFPLPETPVPSLIILIMPPAAISPSSSTFPSLSTRVPSLTIPLLIVPLIIMPPPTSPSLPLLMRFITPVCIAPSASTLKLESEAFSARIRLPCPLLEYVISLPQFWSFIPIMTSASGSSTAVSLSNTESAMNLFISVPKSVISPAWLRKRSIPWLSITLSGRKWSPPVPQFSNTTRF